MDTKAAKIIVVLSILICEKVSICKGFQNSGFRLLLCSTSIMGALLWSSHTVQNSCITPHRGYEFVKVLKERRDHPVDVYKRQISDESPVGAALIGHSAGDKVEITLPSGAIVTYEVVEIGRGDI